MKVLGYLAFWNSDDALDAPGPVYFRTSFRAVMKWATRECEEHKTGMSIYAIKLGEIGRNHTYMPSGDDISRPLCDVYWSYFDNKVKYLP